MQCFWIIIKKEGFARWFLVYISGVISAVNDIMGSAVIHKHKTLHSSSEDSSGKAVSIEIAQCFDKCNDQGSIHNYGPKFTFNFSVYKNIFSV